MNSLSLIPDCVLPGCRKPVSEVGEACQGCITAFGPYLRIPECATRLTAEQIAERDESVQLAYALQRTAIGGRQC